MRKVVCFHNPDEINGYLSNWYLSDFEVEGVQYSSMEQYMMHQKAVLFRDNDIAEPAGIFPNAGSGSFGKRTIETKFFSYSFLIV